MAPSKTKPRHSNLIEDPNVEAEIEKVEAEIAYLAKRHRVSSAVVREIMRRIDSSERTAVEREIRNGMSRRR